jgi:elongin-C
MAEDSEQNKQADWVKIVSKRDGHSFIVPRDVAMGSGFLRNTFDPEAGFVEGTQNTCVVDERYLWIST